MAMQVFHLEIPSDRVDLIDLAKFISEKLASFSQSDIGRKDSGKNGLEKIMSFAGSQKGVFKDMTVQDMRKNRALRQWKSF